MTNFLIAIRFHFFRRHPDRNQIERLSLNSGNERFQFHGIKDPTIHIDIEGICDQPGIVND